MLIEIIKVSVIAYVFVMLTEPGMIFEWYYKLIDKLPDILFKPVGGCLICFSGQFALWYYLFTHLHSYNFFNHITFIAGVIIAVMIYDKLINYNE